VKKKYNRAIILLSGGIDSTVTLYLTKKYGYKLLALIFDYGQRHNREVISAQKIAKLNRIKYYITKIPLFWAKSSLTRKDMKIPFNRNLNKEEIPSTYVPARNLIFLSYAVSLAESMSVKKIFIGAHIQDYSGYPDCRPEFFDSFEQTLNLGIKEKGIKIIAPLINRTKKEIIKMGLSLGVPFQLTWSCYQGGFQPCLRCDSCRYRMQAFKDLNLIDPLLKRNHIQRWRQK
jgi:7-cyano-7-deazaguanine synthase